ncbi:MAG: hypothetical protein ACLUD2_03120 [Clostridium sp.]
MRPGRNCHHVFLATPLLAGAISSVTGIPQSTGLTLVILVIVCAIYTFSVYWRREGRAASAATCTWLFFGLLAYVSLRRPDPLHY